MTGIAEWLASIGLREYAQRFGENATDLSIVRDLTEQDLKDLGVLLGHRRKMLRAIAELKGDVLRTPPSASCVFGLGSGFLNSIFGGTSVMA